MQAKHSSNTKQFSEKQFVEHVGIIFEQTGLPRMAGRIFGCLLIANPPHQSAGELTEALMASKGSISTMTRLLIQNSFIERISLPGIRQDYFCLRPDAWRHLIRHGLEDEISMFRELTEHGLKLPAPKTSPVRRQLQEMRDVYAFLEEEFPALLAGWEHKHANNKGKN
ncbi:GbsR/MarR family transcriptional regulator [Chloroflexota bacterium]